MRAAHFFKTTFLQPEADNPVVLQVRQAGQKIRVDEQEALLGTKAEKENL